MGSLRNLFGNGTIKCCLKPQKSTLLTNSFRKIENSYFLNNKNFNHQKHSYHEKADIVQRKIQVFDVGINYVEMDGNPDHVLLCLPGSLSCIELDFIPLMQKLDQSKYKVVAWDPPGYGGSRPPQRDLYGNCSLRDAKYATQLMKQLGHKKFSMLGWSGGAIAASIMATENPETVNKLVMWGAFGYFDEHLLAVCQMLKKVGIEAIPKKRRKELLQMYGEEYLKRAFDDWVTAPFTTSSVEFFLKDGPLTKNFLNKLTCPTLIIHGEHDTFVHESQAEYLKKNILNSRVKIMPNGAHATHLGATISEFTTTVEDFLDEP